MKKFGLLAVVAALGLVAAVALTFPRAAQAWDIGALPAPYTVSVQINAQGGVCTTFYVVTHYDQSVRLGFGQATAGNFSDCNPQFQQQLDAFVDATINLPPPTTTTAPVTTTEPTTTDTPPTTTTEPAQTVTVTVTTTDQSIADRVAALEAEYAALVARVDAISDANDAAEAAYTAALDSGATQAEAALAAVSAGLNALYELT